MAKRIDEKEAKNRFLRHLERERGEEWEVSAEDFVTDPRTLMNVDYQLSFGPKRIALEIMRLVPDPESLKESLRWCDITSKLGAQFERRGLRDVTVWTPPFAVPKARQDQFVQRVVDKLGPVVSSCAREVTVHIDGRAYTVVPSPGIDDVWFVNGGSYGGSDRGAHLGRIQFLLRQKLEHKNLQLSVGGHERIVLVVCLEETIKTKDVREAISTIDFSDLPNIDKVYYESRREKIEPVHDRSSAISRGGRSTTSRIGKQASKAHGV